MKFVKTLILIILVSGLVVLFQNCAAQNQNTLLGSNEEASTATSSLILNAPFAYDTVVDTISYNSCVGEYLNSNGLHGIKIGASEGFTDNLGTGAVRAGVKLRTEFLEYVGKNIKPRFPSSVITPAQIQEVLTQSTVNTAAHLQVAVRKASTLKLVQDVIDPSKGDPITLPRDGIYFGVSLTEDPLLTALTKNVQFNKAGTVLAEGPRVYNMQSESNPLPIQVSFGYSSSADSTFEVSDVLPFGMGERYSENVRNKFNNGTVDKYILALTYGVKDPAGTNGETDDGLNSPIRKDDKDPTKAFGRGFSLQFGLPSAPSAAGWKNTNLKSVRETNLNDGSPAEAVWECRSYLIMMQKHWNNKKIDEPTCAPLISADMTLSTRATEVRNLRRHYPEANWNIGLFYEASEIYDPTLRSTKKLCLVNKAQECYLSTTTVVENTDIGVNYNPLTECYLSNPIGVSYTNSPDTVRAGGRCAQFGSICVRTGTNF